PRLEPVPIMTEIAPPRFAKVGRYVWFHRNARADHHFCNRADHLWPSQVTGIGPVPGQEPGGIQESLERAQEHARGRNPTRRATTRHGRGEGEGTRGTEDRPARR